ncbi:hypothetical protein DFP72DRAFT_1079047 [Ephemerocybe angulata]|uniref:Uncharacterized protein n=1 Tax=Ephemerocybe angulata TaxID=980116 RepID=A0A8H6LVV9_9AGAR|nr:hypothetical protein DFP72DRAFT_1079047 [Tulosesus angulatus]
MRAKASFILRVASIAFFTSAVSAAPAEDFVPHITGPVAGDVWKVGSTQEVTWNTSNAPGQITNPEGKIDLLEGRSLPRAPS